jgi:hypothetical protein
MLIINLVHRRRVTFRVAFRTCLRAQLLELRREYRGAGSSLAIALFQ